MSLDKLISQEDIEFIREQAPNNGTIHIALGMLDKIRRGTPPLDVFRLAKLPEETTEEYIPNIDCAEEILQKNRERFNIIIEEGNA